MPDKYAGFFKEFGHFLKEGVVSDFTHRDALAKLLRYETSQSQAPAGITDYVARMPEEQKEIYFISAPSREACLASPYYEGLNAKNYETLFLFDPWDEFVMDHLREFDGKKLVAAERAEIALEGGEKSSTTPPLASSAISSRKAWATKSAKSVSRGGSWTAPRLSSKATRA